jgi:hypothetical protein
LLVAAGRGFYIVAPPLFADPPLLWLTTLVTMHLCLRLAPLLSMLLVAYWDGIHGASGTPAAKHPPRWQAASVGYPSPEEGELASRFFENPHLWGGDPVMAVPKEEEGGAMEEPPMALTTRMMLLLPSLTECGATVGGALCSAMVVLGGAVALPCWAAQSGWLFDEQWQGEMLHYGLYAWGSLVAAVASSARWLWMLYRADGLCVVGWFCFSAAAADASMRSPPAPAPPVEFIARSGADAIGPTELPDHLPPTPLLQRFLDEM